MPNVFAQEHGKIFPITTTPASYSLTNNSFVEGNASSGVRLVFVAPKTGMFNVRFELPSGGDYNVDKCTSDEYFSCSGIFEVYGTGTYSNRYQTISATKGDSVFYRIRQYSSSYDTYLVDVSYEVLATYTVRFNGKDTSVLSGGYAYIDARSLLSPTKVFLNWKRISGTGSFSDSTDVSTYFYPTSDAELGIDTKTVSAYALTDKYKSYVYNTNGYEKVSSAYAVRTYFAATDPSYYVLFVNSAHSNYIYLFDSDSSFTSASSWSCSAGVCRYAFYSAAGAKKYFELYQSYSSYSSDTVSARVEKTVKINSETTGLGYVYIGSSSLSYDSTHVVGDTVSISAEASPGYKFDHWEKVSGKCSILDTTAASAKVVLKGDCRVEAVFVEGTVYKITNKAKSYSTANNYYSQSPYYGVRFMFVAPDDGAYAISFRGADTTELYSYTRYSNSLFSSYDWSVSSVSTKIDSVFMSKNDTLFYLVNTYSVADSLNIFSVKYTSITSYKVTLTSASKQCSTSVKSDRVVGGARATYHGYSNSGYRPNGFKIKSGKGTFVDNLPNYATIIVKSDLELELQCGGANLIEITTKEKYRTPNKDFYEVDSTSGMRYVYIAPTSSAYAIRAKTKVSGSSYFSGYFYTYGADSTFYSYSNYLIVSNSNPTQTFMVTPTKGESIYFSMTPYGSSYYDDSVAVYAIKAAIVNVAGNTKADTIPIGDSLAISAIDAVDTGYSFVNWKISSGSGKFLDSSKMSTIFIPSSDSVNVTIKQKKGQIYQLTDKFSGFTTYANGNKVPLSGAIPYYYGVRTFYTAKDTGAYVLVTESKKPWYYYDVQSDSTFNTYYTAGFTSTSSSTRNTLRYTFYVSVENTSNYFLLKANGDAYMKDSIWAKVVKIAKITSDTVGGGYVRMANSSYDDYDYSHIPGDTIALQAWANSDQRFDHWKMVSGKCTVLDSTDRFTKLVITGDCKVRAYFRDGIIYPVTATPTSYTTAKDYYVGTPSVGVYLSFQAPSAGTYAFVTSWANSNGSLAYYRSTDSTFGRYATYNSFTGTYADTLVMDVGDKVYFKVQTNYASDSIVPFWISYATSKSILTVSADSNGTASPSQYNPAWIGPKYVVNASAYTGYRFDTWELVSGTASIDDKRARSTFVAIKKQAEVRAHFKKGSVLSLSKKKKTFNFQTHYYSDASGSAVYFTWTPPDTSWYMVEIESADGLAANWYEFGTDTSFLSSTGSYSVTPKAVNGNSAVFLFRPTDGDPLYWALVDSANNIRDKDFSIKISDPYVLTVSSEPKGRVVPMGEVALFPGTDTVVSAVSYGGYVFDKWVRISGKVTIDDSTSTKTRVKPNTTTCEIQATYSIDLSTEPVLKITDLDLSGFPGICAGVTVKDKNTDKSIAGLDSSDFVLFQDNKSLPMQVTSIQGVSGVSVAIVVDESGSMRNTRIQQAQESIRKYIDEMSPFDRTAIIGFSGGSETTIHQAMTSDKNLLYQAVDRLKADGLTNICTGTYRGLEQIVGETNPTAVIVFSDGLVEGGEIYYKDDVVNYAKGLNTVVHSIAIGTDIRDPLEAMANETGGTYTFAPTADQLAAIYISIRNSVQAKYTICFQSPDTIMNGDEHEVIIKTKFLNKTATDTAYWDERFMPPVIKLTKNTKKLIGVKQKEGDSLEIKVYVSSVDSLASVIVYTRVSSPNASATYTAHPMTHVKDSLWSYVVPGYNAIAPGIDFYVIATNVSGLVGKSPQVPTPSNEPYTIPIGGEAPEIEFMSVSCVDTIGGKGELMFTITDDDGISKARIYYRSVGSVLFTDKKISRVDKKSNDWSVLLPASAFDSDELEFYVRAIDKKGVSARWEKFSNTFVEACRDSNAIAAEVKDSIWIRNGEKDTLKITRLTEKISLSLITEDFTSRRDSVTASLSCLVSGDVESNIMLMEVRSGYYETKEPIEKNEYGVKKNDGKISCAATDTLVATYKDPLYGTIARDSVAIGDDVPLVYQFMDSKCKEDLDSVRTSTSADYCLKIQAPSPSLYIADTLKLLLFTDQGDTIRVEAIETDDYSKEYVYKGSFYFVEDSASLKDSLLDAVLDLDTTFNRVVIQGGTTSDKSKLRKRDSLVVYTNYVAADFAEIYDLDLDGKADSIRIHFKKPLKKKVASIDTVYWNAAHGPWTNVESSKIRITEDSSWAEARVRKPFKYGLTAIDTAAPPYLRVTKTKSEFSQKTMLRDMIGAVPVKAVKRPGQISMEEYLDASEDVAPDTLVITMSEGITNTGKKNAWKDLFRYSKTCKDTVYSPVRSKVDPIVDSAGLVWKFVLADYAIMKDNCITTNPKATFVDAEGNSMGRGGVEVEGRDETVYLYEVSAVEPVHGSSKKHKKQKWIPQGGDSWEEVPDSLTVVKIVSVAPYEADIYIYDNLANVVTNMKQKFGYNGEMDSKIRGNDKNRAKIGYLSWNHRSNKERKVGTGVYIWRIDFKFKDGHTEYRILKTGYMRRE